MEKWCVESIHHTILLINKELGAHYYVHLCPFYALVGEIFKDSGMDRTRTCQEGYGGTPGRSNLDKLHIFEPVSQCSLRYNGVQSWHTPVAAKGPTLCIFLWRLYNLRIKQGEAAPQNKPETQWYSWIGRRRCSRFGDRGEMGGTLCECSINWRQGTYLAVPRLYTSLLFESYFVAQT